MRNLFFIRKYIWIALVMSVLISFYACQSPQKKESQDQQKINNPSSGNEQIKILTDSIEQSPDSADLYFERGHLLIETEDFKRAEKDLKKAIDLKPKASNYYTALGQLYLNETVIDSADKYFSAALRLDAENKEARLQKAFTLWLQKDYQGTLKQTDTLLHQDPDIPDAFGLQSQVYSALGDSDMALQVMEKAIKLSPMSYDARMRMGDLLLYRNPNRALKFYKKASASDTTKAEPYYCMGLIYEKKGNTSQAIRLYHKSITFNAHYLPTYIRLGKLYEKSAHWKKAKKIYSLATRMAPTSSEAYFRKAQAEEKLGERENARSDYNQALIFDEKNVKAKQALKRMK